jgi:RNA polymerase sigma factor (sigma-70 family)
LENSHLSQEQFYALHKESILEILKTQGWGLVKDMDGFIEEVRQETGVRLEKGTGNELPTVVIQATLNRYSHLWVEACRGEESLLQLEAFMELRHHIFRAVQHYCQRRTLSLLRDHEFLEDCVQQATENIWRYLPSIKDAGAFLSIIRLLTHQTIEKVLRATQKSKIFTETSSNTLPSTQKWRVSPEAIEMALKQCLHSSIRRYIILATFIEERTIHEIGAELQLSIQSISQHKSKALKQLRYCQPLLQLLAS